MALSVTGIRQLPSVPSEDRCAEQRTTEEQIDALYREGLARLLGIPGE
jgi:hypothetical protein